MTEFTPDTPIVKALERDPEKVAAAFKRLGLRCAVRPEWCVAVEKETLREAALYHDVDVVQIVAALNALKLPPPPAGGEPTSPRR
jgi:hypothetical protein